MRWIQDLYKENYTAFTEIYYSLSAYLDEYDSGFNRMLINWVNEKE